MRPTAKELLSGGLKAFFTADVTSIRYLTGVVMTEGMLLAEPKGYTLFADSRYSEYARAAAYKGVSVRDWKDMEGSFKKVPLCSFNEEEITVGRLKRWKGRFKKTKFSPITDPLEEFRRSKDAEETAYLRKALSITNALLRKVPAELKPGISEQQLAWKLETWAHELGAEKMSFDSIVAFGTHTSRPHHTPTTRKLKKGMIVLIDTGAVYKGYHADRTEMYFTGPLTAQQQNVYDVLQKAQKAAMKAVKASVTTRVPDRIAREILAQHNLEQYFTYALGHGVGLEIHEGASLSPRSKDIPLLKGEVITIEPGVHIPGKFGMRLEEMVFVK